MVQSIGSAVFIVVASSAYFALAVLGEGSVAAFFAQPPLVALAVVFLASVAASLFTRGNLSPGVREDRGNRWVIAGFGVVGMLAGWLPAYTDRVEFWMLDGDAVRWLGALLFTVGSALRLAPVFVLGHRFSGLVAIQPDHRLVTGGLYGVIRHPSYLGLLVGTLGWGLAFRAGVGVLLAALTLPLVLARIRAEEALLHEQFGAEYDAYRSRTARLIPGLW